MEKVIVVKNISKWYGESHVLKNISFEVDKGTIHGFIGPNGSGKTTTLNILVRLVLPNGGQTFIEGKSVMDDPLFNESLGFVSAEPKFPELRVKEYIENVAFFRNIPVWQVEKKLVNSPLYQFLLKKCSELSTGWKKILQIFLLSLYKPNVLLLDEPFNGLDPTFRSLLMDSLIKMKKEGRTILLSTHILSDLQEMADSITMIKKGQIVYTGSKTPNIQKTYEEYFIESSEELKEKNFFL